MPLFWFVSTVLPVFIQVPEDTSAEVGKNVNIACHAQGESQPIIIWNKVRPQLKAQQH